jgi:hypothetical protein
MVKCFCKQDVKIRRKAIFTVRERNNGTNGVNGIGRIKTGFKTAGVYCG